MNETNPKSAQSIESQKPVDSGQHWLLHHGIKSLLKCDEAETVQNIARYVMSQYRVLRIGSNFVERRRNSAFPQIAAFLGAVTRFLEVRQTTKSKTGIVWVARLDNERRAIEKILPLFPELINSEIILRRPPERQSISALPRRIFPLRRRIFKLVKLLLRREYEFFKILRVVEMIGYYAGFTKIFEKTNFSLAVVSSHSNPHGIAFNLAARRFRIPVMLVTHGMPVKPVAKLEYDLAVVHCEAARQIYAEAECRFKEVLIHGRKQDFRPMPKTLPNKNLTVGIFLCKDVNETRLIEVIERLLNDRRIARIFIRPHPKNLFVKLDEWLASIASPHVERSINKTIFEDLFEADIVLGGNSSVLIEAVTAGRPAYFVENLDYGSKDLHQLIARKLVCELSETTELDFDALLNFYQRPDWINILRFFADIDYDESFVNKQITTVAKEL